MKLKSNKGITMTSMIIYVALFFVFISFAVAISTNMNYKILTEKGTMYANEQYDKLQYNLFKSAKQSVSVSIIQNDIVFSNNDIYHFDSQKRKIYKNDNVLVDEIDNFSIEDITDLKITDKSKCVSLNVTINKYQQKVTKDIFVTVGDLNV